MSMLVHVCNSGTRITGAGALQFRVCAMRPCLKIKKKLTHNSFVTKFNPLKHRISVFFLKYICKYTLPTARFQMSYLFLPATDSVHKELANSKLLPDT